MNNKLLALIALGLFANAGATLVRPAYSQDMSLDLIARYLGEIAGSLGGISAVMPDIATKKCP